MRQFCIAIAFVLIWPAVASAKGLEAYNAKPLQGVAGASLYILDRAYPVLDGLPRLVTFSDDSVNGVCDRHRYTRSVRWGARGRGHGSYALIFGPKQTSPGTCTYEVEGNYVYHQPGVYDYSVRICRKKPKACRRVRNRAIVRDPEFEGTALDVAAAAGGVSDAPLALIRDNNRFAGPDRFTTMIDWHDGTAPEQGQLKGIRGVFVLMGQHTFGTAVPPDIQITVDRTPPPNPLPLPTSWDPARLKAITIGGERVLPESTPLTLVAHVTVGETRSRAPTSLRLHAT